MRKIPKRLLLLFLVLPVVLTTACMRNNETQDKSIISDNNIINSDFSAVSTALTPDKKDSFNIIDKSNIEVIEENNKYKTYQLEIGDKFIVDASYADGVFYYALGYIPEMAQFAASIELFSYNTNTGETENLYTYSNGLFTNLKAFHDTLFWVASDDDEWEIIKK